MPDIETVIKGLEICTRPVTRGCSFSPGACPYEHNGCRARMEADALVLLKAYFEIFREADTEKDKMDQMERHDGFIDSRW